VVLVHRNRNVRIKLAGSQNQVKEIAVLRKLARAAAGLNDDGRAGFLRRFHDRLNLFHIVDVERADAVTALGGLVEQLPHGD
jgi:hypothetical protein